MRLYNFYHGLNQPKTLKFGSFEVEVTQDHCNNLLSLPRRASTTFTFDEKGERIVTDNPSSRGELVETGTLKFVGGKPGPSKPVSSDDETAATFDATLVLSFLTGRRVYLEDDLKGDVRHHYSDGAVDKLFFITWQGGTLDVARVRKEGLASAMYNVVNAYIANELIGMGAYANFALEAASVQWLKKTKATKYADADKIKRCLNEVKGWLEDYIRKPLLNAAIIKFVNLLQEGDVAERTVNDIEQRLVRISSQPSAIYRMENFFSALGLVSTPPTADESERIKSLNKLRNAIAHRGEIDKPKSTSEEKAASIALCATLITLEIAQYYIATQGLGLKHGSLDSARDELRQFFSTGRYNGQDMFGETYEEFIARAENDWIEDGHIDPRDTLR